jgi:hypothetical protein
MAPAAWEGDETGNERNRLPRLYPAGRLIGDSTARADKLAPGSLTAVAFRVSARSAEELKNNVQTATTKLGALRWSSAVMAGGPPRRR